jgi:5'-3' exonuclease
MKMGTDALDMACQIHGSGSKQDHLLVLTDKKLVLQTKTFVKLLVALQEQEQNRLADLHDIYMGQKMVGHGHGQIGKGESPEQIAGREIHMFPHFKENKYEHAHSLKLRESGWRRRYYYYLFSDKDNKIIQSSCQQYMKGIKWCIDYYFNTEYDDDYVYPYMFSPTITDVHNHLVASNMIKPDSYNRKVMITYNTKSTNQELKQKLFAVLPPQSIKTLCPELMHYTNDVSHGMVHYFPYDFKVCTYMKTHGWECIPMISSAQTISIN